MTPELEQDTVSEKIALIDMDGTIADYDASMTKELDLIRSPNDPPFESNFSDDRPDWQQRRIKLIRRQDGFWRELPRIELGFKVLEILKVHGFSLMILTKGPASVPSAWSEKREWCSRHLPGVPVTVTDNDKAATKTIQGKGLVYGKLLFDDYPPYIEAWLKWRKRGKVLMLDQKWNQGFEHPQVFRIKSEADLKACWRFLDAA